MLLLFECFSRAIPYPEKDLVSNFFGLLFIHYYSSGIGANDLIKPFKN
jgi:hypothetical protein